MTAQDLLSVRGLITVAHHVPGRMRLKFSAAIRKHPSYDAIRGGAKTLPGIKSARVNTMARSMVIEYDTTLLPHQTVQELFTTMTEDRVAALLEDLRQKRTTS